MGQNQVKGQTEWVGTLEQIILRSRKVQNSVQLYNYFFFHFENEHKRF